MLLVLILIMGVFVITRFVEPAGGHLMSSSAYAPAMERTQDSVVKRQYKPQARLGEVGPRHLLRHLPDLPVRADDPDGDPLLPGLHGGVTFPFSGPAGLDWWRSIFASEVHHGQQVIFTNADGIRDRRRGLALGQPGRGRDRRVPGLHPLDGVPPPLPRRRHRLLHHPARADDAGIPPRSRDADLLEGDGPGDLALAHGARHEHRLGDPVRVPRDDGDLEPLRRPHRRGGARPRRQRGEDVRRGDAAPRLDRHLRQRSCSASR